MAILDLSCDPPETYIGLTSAALEKQEDLEIASIIGHELGHFLFEHNKLNALLCSDPEQSGLTVLPALGESAFLRWQKLAEVSADRIGLLACADFPSAARALVKACFGLSEKNLNLDIDGLISQIDEAAGSKSLMDSGLSSHPLLPIRLKALHLFSKCFPEKIDNSQAIDTTEEDREIDALMELTRRRPTTPVIQAVMETVAAAGLITLISDGEVTDEEIKILVEILHQFFTDDPEEQIPASLEEAEKTLARAIPVILEDQNSQHGKFIICRLADIALADGALMKNEADTILSISGALGVSSKDTLGIMMAATQSVGFQVDARLNRMAGELRKSLAMSLA